MPIYEYECPVCCHRQEEIVALSQADVLVLECEHEGICDEPPEPMRRVVSMPAPHRVGGSEGKMRNAENIRKRNAAYHASSKGQEEHRHNVTQAHKRVGI